MKTKKKTYLDTRTRQMTCPGCHRSAFVITARLSTLGVNALNLGSVDVMDVALLVVGHVISRHLRYLWMPIFLFANTALPSYRRRRGWKWVRVLDDLRNLKRKVFVSVE